MPFLRLVSRCHAPPLPILRAAALCISLLCLCCSLLGLAPHILSMLCLCSSWQRHAAPLHCRQSRASPLPRCSKLCNALADLQDSLPGIACPCIARHCFSFAIPRLAFSFPFPRSALLFLCFSMLRCSMPFLAFAGRFTAMMFPCISQHCCANPLQINSWLCAAFALLSCALPCHTLLCPCAADQETSAQRKRPLPELRHWPRPR